MSDHTTPTRGRWSSAGIAFAVLALFGASGCSKSSDDSAVSARSDCSGTAILAAMQKAGVAERPKTEADEATDGTQTKGLKGISIPPRRALNFDAFDAALRDLDEARYGEIDEMVSTATIPEIAALLSDQRVSATELVSYYVSRIQRYDVGKLNSVVELDPTALLQAKAADVLLETCPASTSMLGIPVLLKDNITAGPSTRTTAGAAVLADWRPSGEATLVTNLRRSGAIVLGKTNMSEWANYVDVNMPNGYSVVGGQTRNPYGGEETYGSSSGSAVAASARFAPLTVGTETQGSLILPAQINSAVALRPSGGLISQGGVVPLYARQDTAGPMAHTVTDLAFGLNAMAGPDSMDPRSEDASEGHAVDFVAALKIDPSVRIGIPITPVSESGSVGEDLSDGDTTGLLDELREQEIAARKADIALADALEGAGATVVRIEDFVSAPEGDITELLAAGFRNDLGTFLSSQEGTPVKSLSEIVAFNEQDLTMRAPYGQGLLKDAAKTTLTDEQVRERGAAVEAEARKSVENVLAENKVDVILVESQAYAQASTPAVAIQTGYNDDGVPQGATLIGRYLEDAKVLSAAFAIEKVSNVWKPPTLK